mmetsp:Transcript_3106/g.6257  ORF Transcript_3106/g.6257 Transcript_3106/m.6257 type:complete len:446 (-) Transcript_3106:82-1419(-)
MHVRRPLVQHLLFRLGLIPAALLLSAPGSHAPRLKIRAIRTTNQLPVRLLSRKPRLQIVLLDRRVVERPGHDAYHPIRKPQTLVKLLGRVDHPVLLFRRLLEIVLDDAKLLDLLELMHPENTPDIPSRTARLLPETRADPRVPQWERLLLDPLVPVISANGLFRRGDEVLLADPLGIVRLARHFVQLFVEILQLGDARHDLLVHHVRRLEDLIALLAEEGDAVVDEGLVEEDSGVFEEVAPMARDVLAAQGLVAVDAPEEVVVREGLGGGKRVRELGEGGGQQWRRGGGVALGLEGLGIERHHEVVLVLVLRDGHLRIDHVADRAQQFVPLALQLGQLPLHRLDLRLRALHLRHFRLAVFAGLLFGGDDVALEGVDLLAELVYLAALFAPLLVFGEDGVDDGGVFEALSHGLAVELGVAALVGAEGVDVDGHGWGFLESVACGVE